MNAVTLAIVIVLSALVLLPLATYLCVKLGRAGWLRGEEAARRNHNHQQEGEKRNGFDTGTSKER